MKQSITLLILMWCVAKGTSAQVAFGFEGGLNLSNVAVEYPGNAYDNSAKLGVRFGGMLGIPLSKSFSLQPGLFYVQNGTHSSWTDASDAYRERVSVNTIEVPLTLQYKFQSTKENSFFLGAGFYYGRNVSGQVDQTNSGYLRAGGIRFGSSVSDDLKPGAWGVGINGGFQFKSSILVRLQYEQTITNLSPAPTQSSIQFYAASIQIGYLISVPKKQSKPAIPSTNSSSTSQDILPGSRKAH